MNKIKLTFLALSFVMLLFGRAAWAGGWVKFLGMSGVAYDMALDSNGNIYITVCPCLVCTVAAEQIDRLSIRIVF